MRLLAFLVVVAALTSAAPAVASSHGKSCARSSTSWSSTRRTTASTTSTAAGRASRGAAAPTPRTRPRSTRTARRTRACCRTTSTSTSPPLPATCTDTTTGTPFTSHFPNAPFTIDDFIPPTATTCPPPGVFAPNGVLNGTGAARRLHARPRPPLLPGAVPAQRRQAGPLRHRQRRGRADDGRTTTRRELPIYAYLHAPRPPGLRDRRPLLPGGVRRLVPQPPVAGRGRDADVAGRGQRRRRGRPALGGGRQRDAEQLPAVPVATGHAVDGSR